MKTIENAKSSLIMNNLYFDDITFQNNGLKENNHETKIGFSSQTLQEDEKGFSLMMKVKITNEQCYSLLISLVGEFEVEGGHSERTFFLKQNAIAIMFPYMRTQVTLQTAQPGIEPVVLPPLNIKNLLAEEKEAE